MPDGARAVRWAIKRIKPDVVSTHHVLGETAVRRALRRRPLPNITWKHTYGHIGHRGLRERIFERLTGAVVTRYGAVCHTQVRYLSDELGLATDRISVVQNAVAVPAAPAALPAGPPTVLMVAAMRADKDHDLVLRGLADRARAVPRRPAAVRRRRSEPRTPRRPGRSASASATRWSSSASATTPRRCCATPHLLVLASYAVECFPYAALEAMAGGRGVVSTNVGGLPELVDDGVTGRLVPPHDGEALARALLEGLDDATGDDPQWGRAGWDRARRLFPLDSLEPPASARSSTT